MELQPGHDLGGLDASALGDAVVRHLAADNRDFANAARIAATYARPQLRLFAAGTGPFAGADALKYRYVSHLEYGEARRMGLHDPPDTYASGGAA